jgi:hypothetical protein
MPITVPQIDDRGYLDFLAEAEARISVHNPEWTNFNDSDPGITLLQLFAFMADNLMYRSNRYPDLNRLKFLQLLGIGLRPAAAAQGVVCVSNDRGPMQTVTLTANLPVLSGATGFVTQNGLDVLPLEMRIYTRRALTSDELQAAQGIYSQLFQSQVSDLSALEFYQTTLFDPTSNATIGLNDSSTVDDSIWLLFLTRPGEDTQAQAILQDIAGKTITLGVMPFLTVTSSILAPGGVTADQSPTALLYEISTGNAIADRSTAPLYKTVTSQADNDPLKNLTLVQLTLPSSDQIGIWNSLQPLADGVGDFPPALDDADAQKRGLFWIRVRLPQSADGSSAALKASFAWLGMNAVRVQQRIPVAVESVGAGTGEPDQTFTLVNTPVLPESVRLTVNGDAWTLTDDLYSAPPEVPVRSLTVSPTTPIAPVDPTKALVYALDSASGQITFGDGLHGARPPAGSLIFASYAYGGGHAGNVGAGSIKNCPLLPAGFKVSNPIPTWGGADGETQKDGEHYIPAYLRHRDRAVTLQDFKDIVSQTPGIDLGRVEVLPLFVPGMQLTGPGVVTLMVIPNDPRNPQAPVPNTFFLNAVCAYLDPRRLITTEVYVQGPEYVGVSVSVGINIMSGSDVATVREAVAAGLKKFLSPLNGGADETGWPVQKAVASLELLAQAVRVPGVVSVNGLNLFDEAGNKQDTIAMTGLQLPRLDAVSVSQGQPQPLTPSAPVPVKKRLPVPVLPVEC